MPHALVHLQADDIQEKPRSRTRTGASSFTFFPLTCPHADAFVAGPAEMTRGPDKDPYYAEKARLAAEKAAREVPFPLV